MIKTIFIIVLAVVVLSILVGILVYNGQNGWNPEDKDNAKR